MFAIFQALILGIVQGLTEFLPVSSSAHLILVPLLLGWEYHGLTFDVALHAGTAVAVLFYFRKTWVSLVRGFFGSLRDRKIAGNFERELSWFVIIGTIPGALVGAVGEKIIEEKLRGPWIIAVALIVLALVLLLADKAGRKQRELKQLTLADALLIGLSQVLALVPGVSRSGITITTGLFRDLDRKAAAEFSFLLSAPIIVGAALMKAVHLIRHPQLEHIDPAIFAVGVLASAIAGFLCIKYFLRYLQSKSFLPFVIYRIILGVALLAFFGLGK